MSNDQINLTDIKTENKKAIVQYSYPDAIVHRTKAYEFSLRFNGFNPNFSASFDSTYISGVCVKATVSKTNHNLDGTAELVLEHKKSNNTPFYVVIPLDFDNTNEDTSSLDVLFLKNDEFRLLNLDSELNKNKSIYYYKNENDIDIFVFDTKVYINEEKPSDLSDFMLNGIKSNSGFKITNAQNVENEIVCEYETQTDTNADVADTNADVADTTTLTNFLFWFSVLSGSMLILAFSLRMVSTKISPNYAVNVYYSLFFAGFVLFIVNIITISTTTDKKLQFTYGALIFLSLIIMLLSRLALFGKFI
jgi:hypothetical protein